MTKEKVPCRFCKRVTEIEETSLCECGVRLYTTKDLKDLELSLKKQITSLNAQLLGISADFNYRERQRTMTDVKGNPISREENFWKNVHGIPRKSGYVSPKKEKDPILRAIEALKEAGIEL